jgi:hypothetical protein
MNRLDPEKLHVTYLAGVASKGPVIGRHYTLTHSDSTGDLYLTIGLDYNRKQISGLYTRLMRDEVLAEWKSDDGELTLYVYCHVSGGLVFGRAGWRFEIFRREMPLVLEAIRYGDKALFRHNPELDEASIQVVFKASQPQYNSSEDWGTLEKYKPRHASRP